MENRRVENMYSIFGDFSKMLDQERFLGDIFDGYTKQYQQENVQGNQVTFVTFTKANQIMAIKPYRLDFVYRFVNDKCSDIQFLDETNRIFKILQKKFPFACGNRIALNEVEIVMDPLHEFLQRTVNALGFTNLFGSTLEFNFRINNSLSLKGENFNSIINYQQGKAQRNDAPNQSQDVILINSDINTFNDNKNMRFDLTDTNLFLRDLLEEAVNKKSKLFDLVK
jgi:hypothetical protein